MIGVAIIGTGDIAGYHIEAYLGLGDRCAIRALVDILPEKARQKADKYNLDCEAVADYHDLLYRPDIQLVSICLPPAQHCAVTVDFLLAGKHVLCEKPMAPTLDECDRMLAAQQQGRARLSIVAQNRFKPDIMRTKLLLETGALGTLLVAQASSLWWRGSKYYDLWWRGTWEKEGGGCTFIHAVHHIDLLLWLMGEVREVRAIVGNRNHGNSEVEDVSITTIQFKSGAVGTLIASLLHHGEEQRFIIDGVNGSIEIPHRISVSRQMDNGYPEADEPKRLELEALFAGLPQPAHAEHRGQIDDMVSAIEQGTDPLVGGEDGRRTIEFISAVYQSAFTGVPVSLPMTQKDSFYTKEGIMTVATRFHQKTASIASYADSGISVGGTL